MSDSKWTFIKMISFFINNHVSIWKVPFWTFADEAWITKIRLTIADKIGKHRLFNFQNVNTFHSWLSS